MTQRGDLPEGVYDVDYHLGRKRKLQLMYRLRRRTEEVVGALERYGDGRSEVLVDVGTADGMMLAALPRRLARRLRVGVDLSTPLLAAMTGSASRVVADALALPLATASADAVVATAVIEHVPDAAAMLRQCARILRPGGLVVMTTPDPFMERLASMLGILRDAGHQETFRLGRLVELVEGHGFDVVEARKFMFSPIGFPGEKWLERTFGPLGLRWIMANQLLVARRRSASS